MQKFTGHWGQRAMLLFWLGICICGLIFFGTTPMKHPDTTGMIFVGVMLLMAGGMGLAALCGLVVSFTRYELDASGVTRHAWNGAKQMYWSDVSRVETSGQRDSALTLIDSRNEKLNIERAFMGSKRVAELNALLEPRLAPVYARQLREVGSLDNVYHPKRGAGWAGVIMNVIMGLMLAFLLAQPVPADQRWAMVAVMVLFGSLFVFFLYLTIYAFTHSLTVTPSSLTDSSIFRTRELPFARVGSVMSRMVNTKNGSYELTTVEGDGTKIALTSQMKDYALIVAFIREHVGTAAKEQGAEKATEIKRKELKQQRILMPIFALIYMALFLGFGVSQLRDGQAHLKDYRLLETQGRAARGRIVGTDSTGSKHVTYLIRYAFEDANGQPIESASPVSYDDYNAAQVGAPVQVTYVPGRKDVCRIAQSIGPRKAEGSIRGGYIFIVMGILLPGCLAVLPFRKRRTDSPA